jgi:hypothetical protein
MRWLPILLLILPAANLPAQVPVKSNYQITYCKNPQTGKETVQGNKRLTCAADEKRGFWVIVNWEARDGIINYSGLSIASKGMGPCHENDLLLFTFEDQSTTTWRSWTGMDCDGNASFDYTRKNLDEISGKKLLSLKLSNGMSTDTYTCTLPESQQGFFQEAKAAWVNKHIVQVKCPE